MAKSVMTLELIFSQNDDLSRIQLKKYVTDLLNMLIGSQHNGPQIDIKLDVVNIKAAIDTVIPIRLILNKLVTNSIKYAFADHSSPILNIKISENKGELRILSTDNGPGGFATKKWTYS